MDKQWFPAAGILLAAFLVVSASTLTLLSTNEDPEQFPSAPGISAEQRNSILLGILTDIIGGINSVERELEAPGRGAGAFSSEGARGQESPSMSGPLGRVIPEPIPSALTMSASDVAVDSQPVSSEADSVEEILALGTLETITMSSAQPSPTLGSGQKFNKAFRLCGTVPASATLEKTVASKPTRHSIKASPRPIFSRSPCLLWCTLNPTVHRPVPAWRDGHFRPEASSSVALASSTSLGLPIFPWMPNILKATEPLLPASPGRSGQYLTSQVGSRASENTVALDTGSVSYATSVLLLPSATSPSHASSLHSMPPSSVLPLSASPSPAALSFILPPASIPAPVSSVTTGASDSPKSPVSVIAPSTTDSSIKTSNLKPQMALQPSLPGPWLPTGPIHMPTLFLQHFSSPPTTPHSSSFTELSVEADPTLTSTIPHPGQDMSLQDLSFSTPGPSHTTHSVTFRINSNCFTKAVWNLVPLERWLLNRLICYKLQLIYHKAFSNFKNVSALLLRPGSTEVKASLVFGPPDPSALEILWTLYRKVKPSRWSLGHLSLANHGLSSDGYNMTDLTREIINISFTLMRPFLPQLLLPGSQPFILLEKQVLRLVTHEVSRFYKAELQGQPLLLFSNVKEWVSVYMEYKFKSHIPICLQGLASHLAHRIIDPTLQKSSIMANGEKADLVFYEMWLLILGHPFTKALENKTSSESQELRGLLTRRLTSVLQPLQNFGRVVVEEFHQEPLTARVQTAFFGAAPAQTIIQDSVLQALGSLQETEGLQLEMLLPVLGTPSSRASRGPRGGARLNLQLITSLFVLVALCTAPPFIKKQTPFLS
ncbi:LOW QUALITY PROTEIN: taste receptor cell protein 1-like [Mastomys coucha]|uniref:LOW QUALITY PROTEIN: taste receptor cell protein 1-like n=1 Tax=Mastomys coucha TaxID=35658 RepID=UPI00126187D2|nr:LOW QUALITY PROTEIN: taste receptor cell protein 1-like [Mastomys coucha]